MCMVSDCCGAWTDSDYEICSRCGEHCEAVADDSVVEPIMDSN
jgi:hypothetical protein